VSVETYGDVTRASVDEGPAVEVHHQPEATWVYLGEAFPKYNDFPGTRLLIDVNSVQTRVECTVDPGVIPAQAGTQK
jgi:hypothetical protein